jgi:membrane-associated phospholipid phosphatase
VELDDDLRRLARIVPLWLAAWLSVLGLATYVTARIYDGVSESEGVAGLDRPVLDFMVARRTPGLITWAQRYTALGGPVWFPVLLALVIGTLSLIWRSPSGHSLNSAVAVGVVGYLLWHRFGGTAWRLAVLVVGGSAVVAMGLTRVFLGYHWLTDVLVAWALSAAWLAVVLGGHRWWLSRHARA